MHRNSRNLAVLVFVALSLPFTLGLATLAPKTEAAPSDAFYLKWKEWSAPGGGMGFVVGDLYHTGVDAIVKAGNGRTVALNGTSVHLSNEERILWDVQTPGVSSTNQPQMADLDGDGYLEIVVPILDSPAGFYILSHDGTVVDKIIPNTWGGRSDNGPIIGDIDGSGFPTIFFASMTYVEVTDDSNTTGRLVSYKYDVASGNYTERARTKLWHPCSGGLSLADADHDGQFELYMGDRDMYLSVSTDRGYGGGVIAFWASNLKEIWRSPDLLVSSHKPMLADVNGDGRLDVIVTLQRGGLAVLDSKDGHPIRKTQNLAGINDGNPVSGHYQSSVYDVNRDGNLDILMADGDHDITHDLVVWDLVDWREVARIPGNVNNSSYSYYYPGFTGVGQMIFGPQVGPVTSYGSMDIVATNYTHLFVFDGTHDPSSDGTYPIVWMSGNLSDMYPPEAARGNALLYPVMKDIDGDDYVEIIVATQGGFVYCFGTQGVEHSTPRGEVQFYSELRLGAAEYVPPPWELSESSPIISGQWPSNWERLVPIDITQLFFSLKAPQGRLMNYYVTTSPNIGGGSATGISDGTHSINVADLDYSEAYTWQVKVTDGTTWTNRTFFFETEFADRLNRLPTQGAPIIRWSGGNLVARNQSTFDADGDPVVNTYRWYRNDVKATNLLMSFDTMSQTTVKDYSGYGNDGTIFEDVSWLRNGVVGGAYQFSGGYIRVPDANSLDGSNSWTEMSAEAWVNVSPSQGGYSTRILFKQPVYELGIDSGGNLFAGVWTYKRVVTDDELNATVAVYESTRAWISKGTWHHVTFTYRSDDALSLYIDGQLVASTYHSGPIQRSTQPLIIGWFNSFRGSMDEVRILPRSLSPEQIVQDYEQSKNGLSSSSTIVSQEIQGGIGWRCEVIPNDGYLDVVLHQDKTPPTTTNDYDGQWHKADFAINMNASDIRTGAADTYYRINNGTQMSVKEDGEPLITVGGANNTLEYWSVDRAGNVEAHNILIGIKLDKIDPTGWIRINSGVAYTNSTSVVLGLNASDSLSGVAQVRYSSHWVWGSEAWESYSPTRAWTLGTWTGNHTVYYQIRDNANNTKSYQAPIFLDLSPPEGSLIIGNGTQASTDTPNVILHLNYSDSGSGVDKIRIGLIAGNGSPTWGSWVDTSSTVTFDLGSGNGNKTVLYQVRDMAGQLSSIYSKSIMLTQSSVAGLPTWGVPLIIAGVATASLASVLMVKRRRAKRS